WEVNNLAADPKYRDVLERMRQASREWMLRINDTGFMPEAEMVERTKGTTAYDYMRSGQADTEVWMKAAEASTAAAANDIPVLTSYLKSDDAIVRYWGATGLLILGDQARPAVQALRDASH